MIFRKAIIARIGYMHYYSGSQKGDEKPQHGGAYNIRGIGSELYNYKRVQSNLFGFFQPYQPPENSDNPVTVNLERIDPKNKGNDLTKDVLVIFVSKREKFGQVIVGWYNDAIVFREYQSSKKYMLRNEHIYNLKAEIKNSVLGRNARVRHHSYIGDASVGDEVNVGAGSITANFDGEKVNKTNIGDNCYIGSGAILVAPLDISDGAHIKPGEIVSQEKIKGLEQKD